MTYRENKFGLPENFSAGDYDRLLVKLVEQGKLDKVDLKEGIEEIQRDKHDEVMLVLVNPDKFSTILKVRELSIELVEELIQKLRRRFKENQMRHKLFLWRNVEKGLRNAYPDSLLSLWKMEEAGGEPDVVDYDKKYEDYGDYIFIETYKGILPDRKNMFYAQCDDTEKCVVDIIKDMGIQLINDQDFLKYRNIIVDENDPNDCRRVEIWLHDSKSYSYDHAIKGVYERNKSGKIISYNNKGFLDTTADGFRGKIRISEDKSSI